MSLRDKITPSHEEGWWMFETPSSDYDHKNLVMSAIAGVESVHYVKRELLNNWNVEVFFKVRGVCFVENYLEDVARAVEERIGQTE